MKHECNEPRPGAQVDGRANRDSGTELHAQDIRTLSRPIFLLSEPQYSEKSPISYCKCEVGPACGRGAKGDISGKWCLEALAGYLGEALWKIRVVQSTALR